MNEKERKVREMNSKNMRNPQNRINTNAKEAVKAIDEKEVEFDLRR